MTKDSFLPKYADFGTLSIDQIEVSVSSIFISVPLKEIFIRLR